MTLTTATYLSISTCNRCNYDTPVYSLPGHNVQLMHRSVTAFKRDTFILRLYTVFQKTPRLLL